MMLEAVDTLTSAVHQGAQDHSCAYVIWWGEQHRADQSKSD